MSSFQEQKTMVLSLLQNTITLATNLGKKDIAGELREVARGVSEETLMVVVCGEFKRGKSSLINALLNAPGLCPVDLDVATNVVSALSYGDAEKIIVSLGYGETTEQREIVRADLVNVVSEQGNPDNALGAHFVSIETPNDLLRQGLMLVDTPGVGGLKAEHALLTSMFIPKADVVLFVSDVSAPYSQVELDFVKERIAPYCQRLLFPLTKTDAKCDYEAIVADNRSKLAAHLGWSEDQIVLFPISCLLKQDYNVDGDATDLQDSGFEPLEAELWRLGHEKRGASLLLSALRKLHQALQNLYVPLQVEADVCRGQEEELRPLRERLALEAEAVRILLTPAAKWRTELSQGIQQVRREANYDLQKGVQAVQVRLQEYLQQKVMVSDPEALAATVDMDFGTLLGALHERLLTRLSALCINVEESHGLALSPDSLLPRANRRATDPTLGPAAELSWSQSGFVMVRNAMVGMMTGIWAGTAFGPIGQGLGAVAGLVLGVKQGSAQLWAERTRVASQRLRPVMDGCMLDCQQWLQERISVIEANLTAEIDRHIETKKRLYEDTAAALKQSHGTHQATAERLAALDKSLRWLEQLLKSDEQLAEVVAASVEAARPPLAQAG